MPYKNKEKEKEHRKEYYLAHREEILIKRREYNRDPRFIQRIKDRHRKYYRMVVRNNPECIEKKKAYQHKRYLMIKQMVLKHYGGKCVCCGESTTQFLTIDHINGGGRKHRINDKIGGHMYEWLIKNNYPDEFALLCFNCNCAKGLYGFCPHRGNEYDNYKDYLATQEICIPIMTKEK